MYFEKKERIKKYFLWKEKNNVKKGITMEKFTAWGQKSEWQENMRFLAKAPERIYPKTTVSSLKDFATWQ